MTGRVFYRYMSDYERRIVEETRMLRGGRNAGVEETYWTDELYASAAEAKARLALRYVPERRVAFRIRNAQALRMELEGSEVEPHEGEPGGGREWMTYDAVDVEVIEVEDLD